MKTFLYRTHSLILALAISVVLTACGASTVATNNATTVTTATTASTISTTSSTTAPAATSATNVTEAMAGNDTPREATTETPANATEVAITLNGDSITASGAGVTITGSIAQITTAGVYRISGTLANGQISVNSPEDGEVRLILDGVTIHNETGAAIDIVEADIVALVLADNSQNTLTDGANYVFASADVDEPNAALFSKADLTIEGTGALTVQGNFNDGIASKDGLVIAGGNITVTAADDGIRGKDYLVVKDGTLNITAQGDGLKADNEEEADKGYINIASGNLTITAGGDAIQAETDVLIAGGTFNLIAGGGSGATLAEDVSAKGIKSGAELTIDGGTFTIDTADDTLHTNGALTLNAGTFTLATGDDAIHADSTLTINDGTVRISRSNEGIESNVITINGGDIQVVSSDDAINAADGSGNAGMPGSAGNGTTFLYINGGNIVVDAMGDGLDANGAIVMTGGTVLVNGPTMRGNGALDYDASFNISGGTLVAAGSAGMAQAPSTSSQQASVQVFFTAVQPAGTQVQIQNAAGETVLTFAAAKDIQSLVFSSPALTQGQTYQILVGGTAYQSFTVNGAVTTVGSGGNMRQRGPMP